MISCKINVNGREIQLGTYASVSEAIKHCLAGFHSKLSTFQISASNALATFSGRPGDNSLLREFERSIVRMEQVFKAPSQLSQADIESEAADFIDTKLAHVRNPAIREIWIRALIDGIEPHEIELSIEGSFGKDELEKHLPISSHSS